MIYQYIEFLEKLLELPATTIPATSPWKLNIVLKHYEPENRENPACNIFFQRVWGNAPFLRHQELDQAAVDLCVDISAR